MREKDSDSSRQGKSGSARRSRRSKTRSKSRMIGERGWRRRSEERLRESDSSRKLRSKRSRYSFKSYRWRHKEKLQESNKRRLNKMSRIDSDRSDSPKTRQRGERENKTKRMSERDSDS